MTKKTIEPNRIKIKNFDGDKVPEDFDFPSIGIENIDRAVFDLFGQELKFEVTNKGESQTVPVIFATGERFALTRRKKPVRDRNNTNILPLISIVRENLDISPGQSGKGTAISFRAQPNYTVKKRLASNDADFQNILNKQGLKNQDNVATNNNFVDSANSLIAKTGKTGSRRDKSNLSFSKNAQVNLKSNINTNIYELIQTAYPYFVTMSYNVTFWCQYMQQGNQMIEYLLNKIDVPGGEFAIKTKEGFELVAFISDSISFENNFDNMTDDERIIKYNFTLTVPGYLINSKVPGLSPQIRSYYSAPVIDFSYLSSNSNVVIDNRPETAKEDLEKHVLSDISNIEETKLRSGESNEVIEDFVNNPFTKNDDLELLRIKSANSRTGESVVSSRIIKEIDRQYE